MLTADQVKRAKVESKAHRLYDEKGMFLLVSTTGGKLWRLKYRFNGRERLIGLGKYPEVSLADARAKRDEARKLIAAGVDPSAQRKAQKAARATTFEAVAREWHAKFASKWTEQTAETKLRRLVLHIFPAIGSKPIDSLTAADFLAALRKIEKAETIDTAHRTRQICSEVMRYAIASGRIENDPTQALRGALAPVQTKHRAATVDPTKVGEILRVVDGYDGTIIVKSALRLAPLVFVRPGELRAAEWTEIDLDAAEWTIPAFKMKMRTSLTVPLSTQAMAILRKLHPVTGDGRYVFPSARSGGRCMSENAVLAAFRRAGIEKEEMSGHGWRAVARTLLDEVLGCRVEWIEMQLAHAVRDPLGTAYNRTAFLGERRTMMQRWADYLDGLKTTSKTGFGAEESRAK